MGFLTVYCVENIPQCSARPVNLALNSGSVHLKCMHIVGEEGKLLAAAPAVPSSLLYAAFENENGLLRGSKGVVRDPRLFNGYL